MTDSTELSRAAAMFTAVPGQYLTFLMGGETFAVGILAIKEILQYQSMTDVPMMPPCMRGVINLRGSAVPILDLLERFGRPSSPVGKRTCFVILEVVISGEPRVVGIVVDAVQEVLEIAAADIEPPPSFAGQLRGDFIEGIGKVRDKFVILLKMEQLLDLSGWNAAAAGDAIPTGRNAPAEAAV